ncbi:glycosyltransferase, partial [Pseudodesulfovibrio sp.]|nr:glycosyltransferase [Pseudodesulfovibrio sp.]
MPVLSIVIPNYNYGHFADRFFGSLAAQSMTLDEVEFFFVDDGSSDDSIEKATAWSHTLSCQSFTILTPPRSGRPGLVRNAGLEQAKGNSLLCLDPDDTLEPEYIKTCVTTLDENPDIDLVYTDYCENSSAVKREVVLQDFNQGLLRTQNIIPPAAMYRRRLWDSGVRYRDNTEYEDWDFWIQCLMAGARFLHIPRILYNYELHEGNYSQHAEANDGNAKARIVQNNPDFFHPLV